MKVYEHDLPGLVSFYADRVEGFKHSASWLEDLGLMDVGAILGRQADAHQQVLQWAQQLLEPPPSMEEAPAQHALWIAAYRVLKRQAAVFSDHGSYWRGWHPSHDNADLEDVFDG